MKNAIILKSVYRSICREPRIESSEGSNDNDGEMMKFKKVKGILVKMASISNVETVQILIGETHTGTIKKGIDSLEDTIMKMNETSIDTAGVEIGRTTQVCFLQGLYSKLNYRSTTSPLWKKSREL